MNYNLRGTPGEPEYVPVRTLDERFGIRRTRAFNLIREGRLEARAFGRLTLVSVASVRQFIASLPRPGQ